MLRIAHLIDDQPVEGLDRSLAFLAGAPALSDLARHELHRVSLSRPLATRIEADVIVSHLALTWRGMPGLMALRARHAAPAFLHVEHHYSERWQALNVPASARFHALLRGAYMLFDQVIATSTAQAEWMTRAGLTGSSAPRVIAPVSDLADLRALPAPRGPLRRFAAIGRFDRQSGFDILVRAFRDLPGATLHLSLQGTGPDLPQLRELSAGDPRISFSAPAATPLAALSHCDALLMPSRWQPSALLATEARAARRPVIVSSADGLADHLTQGAILVPELSAHRWTATLRQLVEGEAPRAGEGLRAEDQASLAAWRQLLSDLRPGDCALHLATGN